MQRAIGMEWSSIRAERVALPPILFPGGHLFRSLISAMPMATSIGLDQKIRSSVMRMSGRRRRKGVLKHSGRRRRLGAGGRKQGLASSSSKAVAQRLEALRSLIPQRNSGAKEEEAAAAADRLFEETAEYILLLRTQVAVLKRLVDVYSPGITVKNDGDCA